MPFDLLFPDIFPPLAVTTERPAFRLPALERWLARAEATREPGMGPRRWLARRYGLADPVPFAAIARRGEPGPAPAAGDGEAWLRADPVHLAVGQDAVTVHDAGYLDVQADEAAALVAALASLFRDDGLAFEGVAPGRWYVRVPSGEMPATTPLEDVVGRNVFGLLPHGPGRINWGSALTETQMLFATHPVNAAREASGRPTINGVWFWGEGAMPGAIPRAYDAVHAEDEHARGLARLSGVEASEGGGPALAVVDAPSKALRAGDAAGWQRALEDADATWFSRLDDLARRHGTARLVVPGVRETRIFAAGRKPVLAWPRTPRPWTDHA